MSSKAISQKTFVDHLQATGNNIITWQWTKHLLYWIIISAGTMSELVFLVASLWVSINASVHPFVLLFLPESLTIHITELATTAYVALPECILGLAIITVVSHARMWWYNRKNISAFVWMALYALPTSVFLVLSLFTLGSSVANATFILPTPLIVIRALAGFIFALTSLLYWGLGKQQEVDRLQEKNAQINVLKVENEQIKSELLTAQNDTKNVDLLLQETTQKYEQKVSNLQAQINDLINEITSLNVLIGATKTVAKSDEISDDVDTEELSPEQDTGEMEAIGKENDNHVTWIGTKRRNGKRLITARRVLKSNPNIRASDLAKRLQISTSYASQLRAKVLMELQEIS